MDNATRIQAVINTLERMNIPNTWENTDRLFGIYQILFMVRDDLSKPAEPAEPAEPAAAEKEDFETESE